MMSEQLDIIYRDEYLVAINKPSGLLVHRSMIDRHETRFAMQMLRDQIGQHVFPVHRLDKPTSGVLVFALNAEMAALMGNIFSEHYLQKTYVAIVRGIAPEHLLLDYPIIEELDKYTDQKARTPEPKPAITEFFRLAEVSLPYAIDKYPESRYSLVKCLPRTGRKHQIRRHLKHISHPIIGDAKHGKGNHNRFFQKTFNANRLLLAATELRFIHPIYNTDLKLVAPLDKTMAQLIQRFAWYNALPSEWLASQTQSNLYAP
ncbi:tRNA pseudouridine synthase C [Cellvibrio zantedeschiae]|uniref:tRNA pseudouridine synthase C n=1 Tax=Cellvibrio zantedeschiae TaxID=1237077 RepID=A0ABQ3AZ81_9GAMM|nr:tRNA pseudouridine(65) synthase TruC [Cellvibrio zantedeschiae]GGY71109.1 tRNA pseudouridine synthase C [Cellvibrio zantedeschiae]